MYKPRVRLNRNKSAAFLVILGAWIILHASAAFARTESETTNDYKNIGLGQFSIRTHSLQTMLRPGQVPTSLYYIDPGDVNITAGIGYANVWNYTAEKFKVDGEWGNIDIRMAYALTERYEVGLNLPFSTRQGGFLDSSIESFHDTFGFKNKGRDKEPKDRASIEFYDDEGNTTFKTQGNSTGINDIPIFLVWHASKGTETKPAVIVKPYVTIPVGNEDELEGTGDPVYGISIMLAKRLGKSSHHMYAEAEYSYSNNDSWDGFDMNKSIFGGSLIWEFRWSSRTSLIAQYNVVSGIAKDYDEWTQEAHHINVGVKRKISENTYAEISLQENLFHYNTSSDVGINAAIGTRL